MKYIKKKLRRAYAKQDVGNFAQGISALASLWGASKGAYPSAVTPVDGNTPILKYIQEQKTDRQAVAKETAQAMKADQAEYTADLRDARKRYDALQAHNAKAEMQKAEEKAVEHKEILSQLESLKLENHRLSETVMKLELGLHEANPWPAQT